MNAHERVADALRNLSGFYARIWDRVDGAIFLMPDRIPEFEDAQAEANAALAAHDAEQANAPEPVAIHQWRLTCGDWVDYDPSKDGPFEHDTETRTLYTAPPAPRVSVPETLGDYESDHIDPSYVDGWDSCLKAVIASLRAQGVEVAP